MRRPTTFTPSPTHFRCRGACASTTTITTYRSAGGSSPSIPARTWSRRTSSSAACAPPGCARALPRLEPHRAVEPDDLAVEVAVLDNVLREGCVLVGLAQAFRERNVRGEDVAHRLRHHQHRWCGDRARRDRADPNAGRREVARGDDGHADDPGLGRA